MWETLGANPKPAANHVPGANGLQAVVSKAVRRSIEDMIFMPVEKATMLMASIQVLEPVNGRIGLIVDKRLARKMALDIHACDALALTDPMITDFVAELINTIAGQLMSDILPGEQLFQLGLPVVSQGDSLAYEAGSQAVFVQVRDCCIAVGLSGEALLALFAQPT
jgi:CheY-specific phosphatase CheX